MKIIVIVSVVIADGKAGNAFAGSFGGKNCSGRVSQLCMTPFTQHDNPWCHCNLMRMDYFCHILNVASDETEDKRV